MVELSILKISSLELDDKKKKFKYKLIPVSTFQSQVFKSHNSKAKVQQKSKPVADIILPVGEKDERLELTQVCFSELPVEPTSVVKIV